MTQVKGWTLAREQLLRKRWAEGYSASEIARELDCGMSRNAVIGKIHRLGLTGQGARTRPDCQKVRAEPAAPGAARAPNAPPVKRDPKVRNPMGPKPKKANGSLVGHRPNVIKGLQGAQPSDKTVPMGERLERSLKTAAEANAEARRVPIEDLGPRECRWPVNDAPKGGTHLFCGAATEPGKPYCAAHAKRAGSRYQPVSRNSEKAAEERLATFLDHVADKGARRSKMAGAWS